MNPLTIRALIYGLTKIGDPPELKDELAFRRWCKELGTVMATWARDTDPAWDDRAVMRLQQAVSDSLQWAVLYALVKYAAR